MANKHWKGLVNAPWAVGPWYTSSAFATPTTAPANGDSVYMHGTLGPSLAPGSSLALVDYDWSDFAADYFDFDVSFTGVITVSGTLTMGNTAGDFGQDCDGDIMGNVVCLGTSAMNSGTITTGNYDAYDDAAIEGTVSGNGSCHGNSVNLGDVFGTLTLWDNSYSGHDITGSLISQDATYNQTGRVVGGDWESRGNSYNNGTISGNWISYNQSFNSSGQITGNWESHDTSTNQGTVMSDWNSYDMSYNQMTVNGNWNAHDQSYNAGRIFGAAHMGVDNAVGTMSSGGILSGDIFISAGSNPRLHIGPGIFGG